MAHEWRNIFLPRWIMTINRFLRWGKECEEGGRFVGRRHLLVTGKDAVYHHPAVWIFISSGLNG